MKKIMARSRPDFNISTQTEMVEKEYTETNYELLDRQLTRLKDIVERKILFWIMKSTNILLHDSVSSLCCKNDVAGMRNSTTRDLFTRLFFQAPSLFEFAVLTSSIYRNISQRIHWIKTCIVLLRYKSQLS